jgi:hypothetical protein
MVCDWEILDRQPFEDHRIFRIQTKSVRSPRTGHVMNVKAISFRDWVVVLPLTD